MYQVVIERFDEEFEIMEECLNLEDALESAKKIPREDYKSLRIDKIDEKGNLVKVIILQINN